MFNFQLRRKFTEAILKYNASICVFHQCNFSRSKENERCFCNPHKLLARGTIHRVPVKEDMYREKINEIIWRGRERLGASVVLKYSVRPRAVRSVTRAYSFISLSHNIQPG